MSELVQGSCCSEAMVPTTVSELSSSSMNHFCSHLEDLTLIRCGSLPAALHLPPSLKMLEISHCSSIQVLSCRLGGLQKPQVTTSINIPEPSAAVATAREHSFPRLERLKIWSCDGMLRGILRLPTSLKILSIHSNSGLTSLECLLREHPPSLECLWLESCSTLASLPTDPQAYGSLKMLGILRCPAIKKLPRCLQQQLCSIENKRLDARYEGTHVFLSLPHLTNRCTHPSHPMHHVNTSVHVSSPLF